MNKPLRTLLTNLDVISQLEPGHKLYMKKNGSLGSIKASLSADTAPADFWETMAGISISLSQQKQAWKRFWSNESRDTTWNYLETTIDMAIDYSSLESKKEYKDQILAKLGTVKYGIDSLQVTYKAESSFVAKLDTLKVSIDAKLGKLIKL